MTQIAQNPQLSPCSNPSLQLNLHQEPILPPSTKSIAQAPAVSPTIVIKPIIPLLAVGFFFFPLRHFCAKLKITQLWVLVYFLGEYEVLYLLEIQKVEILLMAALGILQH